MRDNPNAFPLNAGEHGYEPDFGMSLRDWFAGQRLVGISQHYPPDMAAREAYEYADAMLTARKNRP